MPDGVALLRDLGVVVRGRAAPFRGIRFVDGAATAEGLFPGPPGLSVRRLDLHAALVERAAAAGVDLCWGVAARGLEPGGVRTGHGFFAARWIVGADGLASRLRRWAGLERGPGPRRRFGVRRHFALASWSDLVEVHWAAGCEAYVTPLGDMVGVAMLWRGAPARFDVLLARVPALAARLRGAPPLSRDRGAGPFHQRVRGVHRGRLALVGDAAGYVDALTGEGVALALQEAVALGTAMARGDLAPYARRHRRLTLLSDTLTHLLLVAERRPPVRRRLMATLGRDPGLFSRLLGIHARALPPTSLGLDGLRALARVLLGAAPAGAGAGAPRDAKT
jgi:flavin-dependent dehydrogenase